MIEFHDVSKTFAGRPAASHLNLNFAEGAFSVLIGTSGSGKSTTLKMINRLVEHDSGLIRFAGEEIRSLPVRSPNSMVLSGKKTICQGTFIFFTKVSTW